VMTPTGATLYDPRAEEHHHLACRDCGRVIDVDGALDAAPLVAAARAAGARPDGMQVVLTGLCPDCAE
jgi:Fe2+ or Zn2+ uptake regulation protein